MCIWRHKLCNSKTGVGPTFTWSNEPWYISYGWHSPVCILCTKIVFFPEIDRVIKQLKKWYEAKSKHLFEILPHRVRICLHIYHMGYVRPPGGRHGKCPKIYPSRIVVYPILPESVRITSILKLQQNGVN